MPAWNQYFTGMEDTSILLTQQPLWVIPKAFLKMWLNTVKIDLHGEMAHEFPGSIYILAADSETNKKCISLTVDLTGLLERKMANSFQICMCLKYAWSHTIPHEINSSDTFLQ